MRSRVSSFFIGNGADDWNRLDTFPASLPGVSEYPRDRSGGRRSWGSARHRNNNRSGHDSRSLAEVAAEMDHLHPLVAGGEIIKNLPGAVFRAVIDQYHLQITLQQ